MIFVGNPFSAAATAPEAPPGAGWRTRAAAAARRRGEPAAQHRVLRRGGLGRARGRARGVGGRGPRAHDARATRSWNSHETRVIVSLSAPARRRGRPEDGGARPPRPHRGGGRGGRRAQRRGRALDGGGDALRRGGARRDAAGHRRLRDLPAAARRRRLDAGADAHGARRGRGPRRGARRRRRRLPREAVLVRRAVRAAARAGAARPEGAAGGARGGRPAARSRHPAGVARRSGDRAVDEGVRAARGVHAPAGRGAQPPRPAGARVGLRLREPLERDRRLRALPAREGRPAVRREEHRDGARARATGCAPTGARRERPPDPPPAHARLHGGDGARAAGCRAVRLLARGLGPRHRARPVAAHACGRRRRRCGQVVPGLGRRRPPRRERRELRPGHRARTGTSTMRARASAASRCSTRTSARARGVAPSSSTATPCPASTSACACSRGPPAT